MLSPWKWTSLLVALSAAYLPQTLAQPLFYTALNPDAFNALIPGNTILTTFQQGAYYGFLPTQASNWNDVGIIYYSATFYDERAYAPIMRQMAVRGYPAFILDLPWSMAFLTPFRADLVIRDYPQIRAWVVAGHGIGGAIASCYAQARDMDGLALFSSYPFPLFNNLKWNDIDVISLWGSNDGITSRQQWEDGKLALPGDTLFLEIDGGNHSFMAYLTNQVNGDGDPGISRSDQQEFVIDQLRLLLEKIQNRFDDDEILDDDCVIKHGSSSSSDSDDSDSSDSSDDVSGDSGDSDEDSESDSVSFDCGSKSYSKSRSSKDR